MVNWVHRGIRHEANNLLGRVDGYDDCCKSTKYIYSHGWLREAGDAFDRVAN